MQALRVIVISLKWVCSIKSAGIGIVITGPQILHLKINIELLTSIQQISCCRMRNIRIAPNHLSIGIIVIRISDCGGIGRQLSCRSVSIIQQVVGCTSNSLADNIIANDIGLYNIASRTIEFFKNLLIAGQTTIKKECPGLLDSIDSRVRFDP